MLNKCFKKFFDLFNQYECTKLEEFSFDEQEDGSIFPPIKHNLWVATIEVTRFNKPIGKIELFSYFMPEWGNWFTKDGIPANKELSRVAAAKCYKAKEEAEYLRTKQRILTALSYLDN